MTLSYVRSAKLNALGELLLGLVLLAALLSLLVGAFLWTDAALKSAGLVHHAWQTFGVWYFFGLALTLFWPIRYRKGMRGLWLRSIPQFLLVALSGPFAIVLGFPM